MFRSYLVRMAIMVSFSLLIVSGSVVNAASVHEKRQEIRNMANTILNRLYDERPAARNVIDNAAGYAVFENIGYKFGVFGSGRGKGIVVNQITKQEIFMRMQEAQVGLGLGIKKFDVIFVFASQDALERFVNKGWEFGGQATMAVTDGVTGDSLQGAVSVSPEIYMYQLTDKGLAVELAGKGTRYYKDKDLN